MASRWRQLRGEQDMLDLACCVTQIPSYRGRLGAQHLPEDILHLGRSGEGPGVVIVVRGPEETICLTMNTFRPI
jgi:hypothetical protein